MAFYEILKRPGQVQAVLWAATLCLTVGAGRWLLTGFRIRMRFRKMKAQGIPIMPHSFLLGHLPVVRKFRTMHPSDSHLAVLLLEMLQNHREFWPDETVCPSIVCIDLWPIRPPMMIAFDPAVSAQFMQVKSLPKAQIVKDFLFPFTSAKDLVSLDGQEWKLWRAAFNPGFSVRNITNLLPTVLEEAVIFAQTIEKKLGPGGKWGEVFRFEEITTNLTLDTITRVLLDVRFDDQTRSSPSPFKSAFQDILALTGMGTTLDSLVRFINPFYYAGVARHMRTIKALLYPRIQAQIQKESGKQGPKTIVDLAFKSLTASSKVGATTEPHNTRPDRSYNQTILDHVMAFVFAGQDTTATTICWIYYELSRHPAVLALMRAEHDATFDSDPKAAEAVLLESPHLSNSLHPVGSLVSYHTEGFTLWDGVRAVHHNPRVWTRPMEFLPERFTAASTQGGDDALRVPEHAWRAFVQGPRNCIGQEQALLEMKLALVLTVRRLEIECAWEEWDKACGRSADDKKDIVHGERLYAVGDGTVHPKDSMPAHVRLRQ